MQYQAEMLVQVLQLAEAKAMELCRSVPSEHREMDSHCYLLLLDVQALTRQAKAVQALAERVQATGQGPLMEAPLSLGLPQELLGQMAELSRQGIQRLAQQALEEVEAMAEVLPPRELVEVPIQGLE